MFSELAHNVLILHSKQQTLNQLLKLIYVVNGNDTTHYTLHGSSRYMDKQLLLAYFLRFIYCFNKTYAKTYKVISNLQFL